MSATATWRALGTSATVVTAAPAGLADARAAVERELAAIDLACSRFREDSELSALNAAAGGGPVAVSPLLAQALAVALRAAHATGGAVDPTLGAELARAGYDRDFALVARGDELVAGRDVLVALDHELVARGSELAPPGDETLAAGQARAAFAPAGEAARAAFASAAAGEAGASGVGAGGAPRRRPAWPAVRLDRRSRTVLLPAGVALDLGATAKALAADRCAWAAFRAAGCGVLVSLGGDVAVAGPAPAGGWAIRVTEDHAAPAEAAGQVVTIRSGGLATSGTTVRRWRDGERPRHHILDPRTGEPAAVVWRTASVAALSCVDANTASTAAIVRGADAAPWLLRHRLPARLVSARGRVLLVGAWPRREAPSPAGRASAA